MQEQQLPGMPEANRRKPGGRVVHIDAIWGVRISGEGAPGYGLRLNFITPTDRIQWSHQFPLGPHEDPRHVGMCVGDLTRRYGKLWTELEAAGLEPAVPDLRALLVEFTDLRNAP